MENKKSRVREQCSDCFYNGICKRKLSQCEYLKRKKVLD